MTVHLLTLALRRDADVVEAHRRARELARRMGFGAFEQARLGTAVSEISRNAVRHAGGGEAAFELDDGAPQALGVVVRDHGPGIADAEALLAARRPPGAGSAAGLGLAGARRLVDLFDLSSSPAGLTVRLGQRLPSGAPRLSGSAVRELAQGLEPSAQRGSPEEVARLERLLLEREQTVATLSRELEETNRGVLALCAELEERAEAHRHAAELKGRLLSDLGHELRTPLHSILALSQFLLDRLDGDLTPEQGRQVGILRHTAEDLAGFVDDLLDLARAEAGRAPLRVVEFPLDQLFGTLRGLLRPLARPGVELRLDPGPPGTLRTDEGKLAQVLRNLLANALAFTAAGHVRVWAEPRALERVRIWVEDTGVGISEEDQARIFEEFTRVDLGHPGRKGTGLGLPLARRLAGLLGGAVGVESEPGVGSRFWVEVPRRLPETPSVPEPRPERSPVRACRPRRPGDTVVVAIADEATRYLAARQLSGRFRVLEASTAGAALGLVHAERPCLVFLDVALPDLGGAGLEPLLGAPPLTGTPIALVTPRAPAAPERSRLHGVAALVSRCAAGPSGLAAAIEDALLAAGAATRGGDR